MPAEISIATPSKAWETAEKVRCLHRWLCEVATALREITEEHLPRRAAEESDSYAYRCKMAHLWPQYPLALRRYVGHLASNEFTWEAKNGRMAAFYDDVDRRGNNLKVFAQRVIADIWQQGRPFVLCESVSRGSSEPRWVLFETEQITNDVWGTSENGKIVPKRVHIRADRREGLWGFDCGERYWVLLGDGEPSTYPDGSAGPGAKLGARGARQEFWRPDPKDKTKWLPSQLPDEQPARFPGDPAEIPGRFFPYGRTHKRSGAIIPPTEVLADLCLQFFRQTSDHGGLIEILRTGVYHWAGMSKERFIQDYGNAVVMGYRTFLFSEQTEAKLENVETSGTTAELSFRELERYEAAITLASLAPINKEQVTTLGENLLHVALAEATLAGSAVVIKDGLEDLMRITAAQMGLGESEVGELRVPTEFMLSQDEQKSIAQLNLMRKNGDVSQLTYLSKVSALDPELEIDPKAEAQLIAAENKDKDARAVARTAAFSDGPPLGEGEE